MVQKMNQTFRNRKNSGQLLDLSMLAYDQNLNPCPGGALHAADIDAVLEIHSTKKHPVRRNAVVLMEYKCRDVHMPLGQEVLYTRLADMIAKSGTASYVIECQHHQYDADKDIDGAASRVGRIYVSKLHRWLELKSSRTVKELLDDIVYECKTGVLINWNHYIL